MILGNRPRPEAAGSSLPTDAHASVVELTERLFQQSVTIRRECDPEIPAEYFVIETPVTGEVDDIVRLHQEWHRALGAAAGENAVHYRLSLHPQ